MAGEMGTSEVLNKAADLIEERGWATGPSAWSAERGRGLCLEGGILAALGGLEFGTPEFWSCPAYRAVHEYLAANGDIGADDYLWEFNDDSAAERVIGVLRATALIEAARERESVEV